MGALQASSSESSWEFGFELKIHRDLVANAFQRPQP
jgi:hypothetical protein